MGRAQPSAEFQAFDFGAHLHPASVVPDGMAAFDEYVGPKHTDVDACAEWFDAVGVVGAALSQPYFMGHGDAEATAEANDALLEAISGYPQFYGLAAIPTAAGGQAAAEEFERCLEAGYHGGALETKSDGIELDDREVEPILEIADRTGVPVLVHPKLNESLHPDVLDDRYRLNAIFGREAALSESIFKVIHDGVLDRYPDLTLVYHHLGGNVASMLGRVHLQLDAGRWPGQDRVLDYEEFKTRLETRLYYDTSGFFGYRAPLETTLREIPSSQVLFGTDSPYEARTEGEYRELVETVEEAASSADARKVLADNALELLER
jgi:predicted TIM-barrel fold metal-dependent hydrolase